MVFSTLQLAPPRGKSFALFPWGKQNRSCKGQLDSVVALYLVQNQGCVASEGATQISGSGRDKLLQTHRLSTSPTSQFNVQPPRDQSDYLTLMHHQCWTGIDKCALQRIFNTFQQWSTGGMFIGLGSESGTDTIKIEFIRFWYIFCNKKEHKILPKNYLEQI